MSRFQLKTCLLILPWMTTALLATAYEWSNNTGGFQVWNTAANWNPGGGPPNSSSDSATFGTFGSGLTANVSIAILSTQIVNEILFDTNTSSFTYTLDTNDDFIGIQLTNPLANPKFQVNSGAQSSILSTTHLIVPTATPATTLDINIASGKTFTLDGAINGATTVTNTNANVTVTGPGILNFAGNSNEPNRFQGLLTISGGATVNLNKIASTNAFSGNVLILDGTLKMVQSDQMPTASIIQLNDPNAVFDANGQTERLGGIAIYSGTVLNATSVPLQLEFDSGGSTAGTAALTMRNTTLNANLATRNVVGTKFIVFDATNNGTATLQGTYNLRTNPLNFSIASGSAAIDMTVSSVLSNGSVIKSGPGVLEFTGVNTYTGTTTISQGTLLITSPGQLSNTAVTVSSGATLGGTGTIGIATASVANSGTVAPGLSPGTLTINGSYTQTALGTLDIELLSPTSFDQLIVNPGSVSLDGTLNLNLLSGYSLFGNNILTLIDNTGGGGRSGMFSTVTQNFPPGSTFNILYNANSVQLDFFIPPLTPPPVPPPPSPTPNQTNVLDYLNSLTTIPGILAQLSVLTPDQLGNALNAIAPTRNAIGSLMSVNTLFTTNNNITNRLAVKRFSDRFANRRGALTSANDELHHQDELSDPHLIALSICGPKIDPSELIEIPVPTPRSRLKRDLWAQGFENWTDEGGTPINTGFTASAGGPVIGCDWSRENWIAGAAAGYARTNVLENQDAGRIESNAYFLNLYGTISKRWVYLEAELLAAYTTFQEIRNIDYPGFAAKAKSEHHGYELVPHGGIGLLYDTRWGMVQWYANVDWAFVFEERFKEHGAAPLDMAQAENRSSMVRTEAGVNVYHAIETRTGIISLKETAAYVYKQPFQLGIIQAQIVGASGFFIVESFNEIQHLGLARLELYYRSKSSDSYFGLGYQGEFGSKYSLNAGQLTVGKYF